MPNYTGALGGAASGAAAGSALGPWGALAGGAAGGLAGLFSGDGSEDEARRRALIEEALAQLQAVNPEAGASAYGSNQDFTGALSLMRQKATEGGMTGADRLAAEQASNDAAVQDRMRSGAIQQGLASRGQAGGGAELAARLVGGQGTVAAQHGAGAIQAGAAQGRALQALQGWGGMAGEQAGASDAISRFNAHARLQKAGMYGVLAGGAADQYGRDAQRERQTSAGVVSNAMSGAGAGVDRYLDWRKKNPGA